MSDYRFTDGNLIVLYVVHKGKSADSGLPDYVIERIKVGVETYGMILRSRPDKHKTMVMIVGEPEQAEKVKAALVHAGVKHDIIAIDSDSQNMAQTMDKIAGMIKSKPNPPFVYFVG